MERAGVDRSALSSAHTRHWLYKNIVMEAAGRILPCCGAPGRKSILCSACLTAMTPIRSTRNSIVRLDLGSPEKLYYDPPAALHSMRVEPDQCEYWRSRSGHTSGGPIRCPSISGACESSPVGDPVQCRTGQAEGCTASRLIWAVTRAFFISFGSHESS